MKTHPAVVKFENQCEIIIQNGTDNHSSHKSVLLVETFREILSYFVGHVPAPGKQYLRSIFLESWLDWQSTKHSHSQEFQEACPEKEQA